MLIANTHSLKERRQKQKVNVCKTLDSTRLTRRAATRYDTLRLE